MWTDIIYRGSDQLFQEPEYDDPEHWKIFTSQIAEGLYTDIRRLGKNRDFSDEMSGDFTSLHNTEKSFWYDYASAIPDKFKRLNLFIRPFEDFCRTCIITDKEINTLVQTDLEKYCREMASSASPETVKGKKKGEVPTEQEALRKIFRNWSRFSHELNYLVPVQLKKNGYEIIRHEEAAEINMPMIKKLARTIHAKYLQEMRSQHTSGENNLLNHFFYDPEEFRNQYISDFDHLPDEIKYSNIDNAAHIPTKLLSIGYKIRHVRKGFQPLTLHLNDEEIETMSVVEHIRWSWDKRLNGWSYSNVKDEVKKTHPGLIPYNNLPESEKEKDRELVRLIPSLLHDIDYEAIPVDARKIRHLSYALKPQSIIHKILNETRELNNQIRSLVTLPPEIEEMVRIRNKKIEEAIREVEESYNYAQHIQETFLPADLYVRECFPESFILFKPKDIVSGDFYFFSRLGHLIIFAVADCTGHGIPGALLSTIGYGIIDQAVNEIKLTDPSNILYHLYSRIHIFLRKDTEEKGISDDMDIVLCILDIRTNILTYAGVKNSLYHIKKGELLEYKARNSPEDSNPDGENLFISEKIQLDAGDTIYLCSDGYVDQFGGRQHKKYQSARLKNFLQSIHKYSMPEQSDMLHEEIEQWRDENREDQTDDILIIGIRL
jgi:serine phosphatase RsbU (regulator of sigma subunit)